MQLSFQPITRQQLNAFRHVGMVKMNQVLFKCHSLPEGCCWPCPFCHDHSGSSSDGYFHQDNTPCHTDQIISNWFLEHGTEFTKLKWPPQSLDLNPRCGGTGASWMCSQQIYSSFAAPCWINCAGLPNTSRCIIWSGSFSRIHTPQGGPHIKLFQCEDGTVEGCDKATPGGFTLNWRRRC